MMDNLFNSEFENAIRLLLLMNCYIEPKSLEEIYMHDFMAEYGKTFSVADTDLNGENPYMYSEFASKRETVRKALRELVLEGLAVPSGTASGILYELSDLGKRVLPQLDCDYAAEYTCAATQIIQQTQDMKPNDLLKLISNKAMT